MGNFCQVSRISFKYLLEYIIVCSQASNVLVKAIMNDATGTLLNCASHNIDSRVGIIIGKKYVHV